MDTLFPFGLPSATALYLVLYIVTFAIHQGCMHYVVAGSLCWLGSLLFAKTEYARSLDRVVSMIVDWLPLSLSAAITAGVAPLLFVQIVYPTNFYSANLLLGWRWMIVVPVLIVAFYGLYLAKSPWINSWPHFLHVLLALSIVICFLFVGFCWTANHVIANSSNDWPKIYASGATGISSGQTSLRVLFWVGCSFASIATMVLWQSRWSLSSPRPVSGNELRYLALLAMAGILLAATCGTGYLMMLSQQRRVYLFNWLGLPYLATTVIAAIIQLVIWTTSLKTKAIGHRATLLLSFFYLVALASTSVLREAVRLSAIPIQSLYAQHENSANSGGLTLFLVVATVNCLAIAFCIWLVRKCRTQTGPSTQAVSLPHAGG